MADTAAPADADRAFADATRRLNDEINRYDTAFWPWLAARVAEAFADARTFWCCGEWEGDTLRLALRRVRGADGSLVGGGHPHPADDDLDALADDVGVDLDHLAALTGDRYDGWVEVNVPDGVARRVDDTAVPG